MKASRCGSKNKKIIRKYIVVVGEGKTEYFYFSFLKKFKKWRFKFEPHMPQTSSWMKLIDFAKRRRKDREEKPDLIFCVFDLDKIIEERRVAKLKEILESIDPCIVPIITYPCFEYWFLLHFDCNKKNISSKDSEKELQKCMVNYEKTDKYLKSNTAFSEFNQVSVDSAIKKSKSSLEDLINQHRLLGFSQMGDLLDLLDKCNKCDNSGNCIDCISLIPTAKDLLASLPIDQ